MASKFSARECIPIEYIEEQIEEYAKFDHLRANAEFLDWFIKDYKDNAMANYEWTADTPQTKRIKTTDYCDICNHKGCDNCIANNLDDYCVPSGYAPKDTPQTDCGWGEPNE